MINEKLNELYDRIYKDDSTRQPRRFIQLIESDLSVIDTVEYENYSEYFKATRLIADYGLMLVKAGYIKKSLPHLENAIKRIELDKEVKDVWEQPIYESLIFNHGVVQYKLRKKASAKKAFKSLTVHFPENDLYDNWLKSCSDNRYAIIEWICVGITTISIFFTMILQDETGLLKNIALSGIVIGIIGGLTINLIRKRSLKI
jgi:hypothetical protein